MRPPGRFATALFAQSGRVQVSPRIMNVAVRCDPQHSCLFGQRASSQTVFKRFLESRLSTNLKSSVKFTLTRIQSGFFNMRDIPVFTLCQML